MERLAHGGAGDTGTRHRQSLRPVPRSHRHVLSPHPVGTNLTWRHRIPWDVTVALTTPGLPQTASAAASARSRFTTTPSSFTVKLTAESKQERKPACFLRRLSLNIPFFPLIKASWSCPSSLWPPTKAFGDWSIPFRMGHPCRNPPAWARQIYTAFET